MATREKHGPDDIAGALLHRGKAYLGMGKAEKAKEDFAELRKLQPTNGEAISMLALAIADQGELDSAIDLAKEAVRIQPKQIVSQCVLANILGLQGKFDDALEAVKVAMQLDETSATALDLRALILYQKRDYKGCLESANRSLELCPFPARRDPDKLYYVRGFALFYLKGPREALGSFLMARHLNPDSVNAHWGLCSAYHTMGKWRLAAKSAEALAKLAPKDAPALVLCATCQASVGDAKSALVLAEKAAQNLAPKDVDNLARLANVYLDVGEYKKAAKYFDQALEMDTDCLLAIKGKASLRATCPDDAYRNGDEALTLAKKAINHKLPKSEGAECLMLLAEAYAEAGDFKLAAHFAQQVLEWSPENDFRRSDWIKKQKLFESGKPFRRKPL